MKCRALKSFASPQTGPVAEGDEFECPDGCDFCDVGLAEPLEAPEGDDLAAHHVGGGWYEIDGEKVQGKAAAREALAA